MRVEPFETSVRSGDAAVESTSRKTMRSPLNPLVDALAMLFAVVSSAFDWAIAPAAAA
jgi:hypothetical protein